MNAQQRAQKFIEDFELEVWETATNETENDLGYGPDSDPLRFERDRWERCFKDAINELKAQRQAIEEIADITRQA